MLDASGGIFYIWRRIEYTGQVRSLSQKALFILKNKMMDIFKRVENIHVRDIKTNSVKLQKETVHDEMYEITKGSEYDYQVSYDDPDSGHQAYLRFKKV